MLEEVPCNLCGSTASTVVFNRPYRGESSAARNSLLATTDVFDDYGRIVQCAQCGLVYTNPRPKAEDLAGGYATCVDESYTAESSSRSINAHFSLNTIKRHVKSGKLVEVGASIGYFLNAARVDFEVAGLEPSQWACDVARKRFKLDMRAEMVEGLDKFPAASLDVIAMIDVIEHLPDPMAALRKAHKALTTGGLLYLVTPDIGSLSAKILRGSWWGLRPAHIYYFDDRTLAQAVGQAGFDTIYKGSFGRIFSYGYWSTRLRHYPKPIYNAVRAAIALFDVEDKFLYLNTRDTVELCARKR